MSGETWASSQRAFGAAAAWFAETVRGANGRWEDPGLGVWTVRDLIGHTSRALVTVDGYLDTPPGSVDVDSAAGYFAAASTSLARAADVAQRGRDAGAALGADIVASVSELVGRVVARINAAGADILVGTPVGGMYLADYLPTRTFELVVHTCDLAAAVERSLDVPPDAALEALALAGQLAVRGGQTGDLLLAATGRRPLPAGFTVL